MGRKGKEVTVGSLNFSKQGDALAFFKEILNRYQVGQFVGSADEVHLRALLATHVDFESKTGSGVESFQVNFDGYRGKCFWVVRTDGTKEDFSYQRCVRQDW
jgi:hypothetical protein